jgi:hypothetical protein
VIAEVIRNPAALKRTCAGFKVTGGRIKSGLRGERY